jgi:hypothetical protein
MTTAVRSTAIVSSLFPSEVRDRLYPASGEVKSASSEMAKGKLNTFLRESQRPVSADPTPAESSLMGGTPIAELYPETTVLFADISGYGIRRKSSIFWKAYTPHLMPLQRNVVFSRSKRLVIAMLPWWGYPHVASIMRWSWPTLPVIAERK